MKLTSRGRYAVIAILDLALYSMNSKTPVTLSDICARQDISLSYLEIIFSKLKKSGIVVSVRGPGGGYYLAQSMEKVSIWEIIVAVDENLDISICNGQNNCHRGIKCIGHHLWDDLTNIIRKTLLGITVGDLVYRNLSELAIAKNIDEKEYVEKLESYVKGKRIPIQN